MPQQKKKGKRSSKIHTVTSRPSVRIPADQKALGRYGYRCVWSPTSGYRAVPMGSNARR